MPPKIQKDAGARKNSTRRVQQAAAKGRPKAPQRTPEELLQYSLNEQKLRLEQLEGEKAALDASRGNMQLERDKINAFWDIAKQECVELKAALRQKARDAEELEDKHQVELKVHKQKVKHLLYEHKHDVEALKIGTADAVRQALEGCASEHAALRNDRAELLQKLREQSAEADEALRLARAAMARDVSRIRTEAATTARELALTYEAKAAVLREELDARHKAEAQALEDARDKHVQELVREQTEAYEAMRCFFNDVVNSSLDLIKELKADGAELKRREAAAEALAHELALENRGLKEPLRQAREDAQQLRAKLRSAEDATSQLSAARKRAAAARKRIKDLEWKNEVLTQMAELGQQQN